MIINMMRYSQHIDIDLYVWWGINRKINSGYMLVKLSMNNQSEEGKQQREDSEVVNLQPDPQNDEESFGDLQEDNAAIQQESGQRIVIDEDTMQSNDLLVDARLPYPKEKDRPLVTNAISQVQPRSEAEDQRESFYKGLISKLEEYSYNDQTLQPSYAHFEIEERKYLEQVKVIYCHFLIGDKALSSEQYQHLRALLFVPKYGESLVKWGNKKYDFSLTLPMALERLDHLQKLTMQSKRRCREQVRLLLMLALLLIVIKLLS